MNYADEIRIYISSLKESSCVTDLQFKILNDLVLIIFLIGLILVERCFISKSASTHRVEFFASYIPD